MSALINDFLLTLIQDYNIIVQLKSGEFDFDIEDDEDELKEQKLWKKVRNYLAQANKAGLSYYRMLLRLLGSIEEQNEEFVAYIEYFEVYCHYRVKDDLDNYVEQKLRKSKHELNQKESFTVLNRVENMLFLQYLLLYPDGRPFELEQIMRILSEYIRDRRLVKNEARLLRDWDIIKTDIKTFSLNSNTNTYTLGPWTEILMVVQDRMSGHEAMIDTISIRMQKNTNYVREQYIKFLEKIGDTLKFDIDPVSYEVGKLYQFLLRKSKKTAQKAYNKRQAYTTTHNLIQPFFDKLLTRDQFETTHPDSIIKEAYPIYQRDSLYKMLKPKNRKFL